MPCEIIEGKRCFHPGEIVFLEQGHEGQAFFRLGPGGGGVDHQAHILAHVLARGANELGGEIKILAPERIGDDLDGFQAELQSAIDVLAHSIRRLP